MGISPPTVQKINKWTKEEEKRLLELIGEDVKNHHYGNASFCRYLASEMNKIFGKTTGYRRLTGDKVGYKIKELRRKGNSATPKENGLVPTYKPQLQ